MLSVNGSSYSGVQQAVMTKAVCYTEALALLLNDFKCHHSEMIHCVCNFCVCVRLYICAYVSHKKEDTRTESALLFSNELRSPAVSLSD